MNENSPAPAPVQSELGEYAEAVLDVVDQVPAGGVTTYGRIAAVLAEAGLGGGPRSVGAVLAAYGSAVAWWRVLPAAGTAPVCDPAGAHAHWYEEGTPLRARSRTPRVDLVRALAPVSAPGWVVARTSAGPHVRPDDDR